MRFRSYIQEEASDCGHTCLQMIAAFYNKKIPLEFIRKISGEQRGGVTFIHIKHAAEKLGFLTAEIKIDWKNLIDKVDLPCIIHWQGRHYIVLYKVSKRNGSYFFHIADPAYGKIVLSLDEFLEKWYDGGHDVGYAMAIVNDPDSAVELPARREKFSDNYLIQQSAKLKKPILFTTILLLFAGGFTYFSVKSNQWVIDLGINGKNMPMIIKLTIFLFIISISKLLSEILHKYIIQKSANKLSIENLKVFLKRLTVIKPKFFEQHKISELLQKMDEHNKIEEFTTQTFPQFIYNISLYIFYSIILFPINKYLFVWMLLYSVVASLWMAFFTNKRKLINYQKYDVNVDQSNFLYEFIIGMQEIKLFDGVKRRIDSWESKQAKEFQINLKAFKIDNIESIGTKSLATLNLCVFTITGAVMIFEHKLTMGEFFSIGFIIGQLNAPIEFLSTFFNSYIDSFISGKRINSIFNKEVEDESLNDGADEELKLNLLPIPYLENFPNNISFRNVNFSYDKLTMPNVLDDFSVDIKVGRITAIVGESGSGKSTLAKLLLKLIEPDSGVMAVNDLRFNDISPDDWRKKCGAVFQDGMIFSDSIANNISLKDEAINIEQMELSCKIAGIDEFINRLPNGYDTNLSQAGINLSKGQYQRLLIARAIYSRPDILIFDEATSALDAKTEFAVMKNLWEYFAGKTVIIIAHRLSTIKNSDEILFMKDGKIEEVGTHEELLSLKGGYQELFSYQMSVSEV
jgi:ATP-binding cassette subfamily B protein